MKTLKYFLEFIFIIFLFLIFKLLGRKLASNLGCYISIYIGSYFRSKIGIQTNLKKAFPKINNVDEKNTQRRCGATLEGLLQSTYT